MRYPLALSLTLIAACGGGGGSGGSASTPLPTPTPAPSLALRASVFLSGLAEPIYLTAPAGDGRQFVVERAGRIRVVKNGSLLTTPFLDISARISTEGEGGLLSMAFDPLYNNNGQFYVYYVDSSHNIVVERYAVSANPDVADATGALEIIRIAHPNFTNHYGGTVAFGPDGMLYMGTGDGGSAGDPNGNAQNPASLLGKLLRLDVSHANSAAPYAIPASNPFSGQAGKRGEIWATGLRNPWRYTFDGASLIIADVGQDAREEIDIQPASAAGLNYGWRTMEGSTCYKASSCDMAGLVLPVLEYSHASGCSITGGFVYRGKAIPELAGRYFYSDYCNGFLKSMLPGGSEQKDWLATPLPHVVSFGQDADGEIYILSADGNVYKITKA